jgi:hypothetical protein
MRVKCIIDEDFVNYKKPSMFIGTISCGGKCCHEAGIPLSVCQNDGWRANAPIFFDDNALCQRDLKNKFTNAIVFGGLEPFEQFDEMEQFISTLREKYLCGDDVVIYTGYNQKEILDELYKLWRFRNIVIKYGRFVPNSKSRYDAILGVNLSSANQYAERY